MISYIRKIRSWLRGGLKWVWKGFILMCGWGCGLRLYYDAMQIERKRENKKWGRVVKIALK